MNENAINENYTEGNKPWNDDKSNAGGDNKDNDEDDNKITRLI